MAGDILHGSAKSFFSTGGIYCLAEPPSGASRAVTAKGWQLAGQRFRRSVDGSRHADLKMDEMLDLNPPRRGEGPVPSLHTK